MFGTDGVVETDYKDFVSDGGGANPTFKFTLHLQAYMKEAADPENGLPETKKLRQEQSITVTLRACSGSCASCEQKIYEELMTGQSAVQFTTTEIDNYWFASTGCASCVEQTQPPDAALTTAQTAVMKKTVDPQDNSESYLVDRKCATEDANQANRADGNSAGWGMIWAVFENNLLEKKCSDVIFGCDVCVSSTQCLNCNDSALRLNKFRTRRGQEYLFCTNEVNYKYTKPDGSSTNDVNPCMMHPDSQGNAQEMCKYCQKDSDTLCERCKQPFFTDGTKCVEVNKDVSATAPKPVTNYFVASNSGDSRYDPLTFPKDANGADVYTNFASTPEKPLKHLQQVFLLIEKDRSRLDRYHDDDMSPFVINIYLGKGTHHFYTCNMAEGIESCGDVFCHGDLSRYYQLTDNIVLNFKPLRTDSMTNAELQAHYESLEVGSYTVNAQTAYDELVVPTGDKPTIALMDNEAYFNITRSATFEDIIFRGDYAMLATEDTTLTKSPRKFCEIDEKQDLFSYGSLILKKTPPPGFTTSYECQQLYFQAAVVDTQATDDKKQCVFEHVVGSVRACSGEPYHADYSSTFGGGRIRYKRRKVLFNLYNFDLDSSRYTPKNDENGNPLLENDGITRKVQKPWPLVKLTITNCEFKYFLKDYEALIYAETSIVERKLTQFAQPYVVQMGDDRGIQLKITKSTFQHSSFCKGLIVYREQPELLPLDNHYLVMNFRDEADNRLGEWDELGEAWEFGSDKSTWPYIEIEDSVFENLNHGKALTHLSVVEDAYYWAYIAEMPTDVHGKLHPYFDHHGAVLNIEGFPGTIDFVRNDVKNNMYFINDVFPSFRPTSVRETPMSVFLKSDQVHLVKCESDGTKVRFFGDHLNAYTEQNARLNSKLEKHSAIYIESPKWPVYFSENDFTGNVGVFGGAIAINTPVFKNATEYRLRKLGGTKINYADLTNMETWNDVDVQPVIVISNNRFEKNQAYLSGNAVYVRYTRQHYGSQGEDSDWRSLYEGTVFAKREEDYLCGGGLLIKGNIFADNSAVTHSSHGGAVSIECDFIDQQTEVTRNDKSPTKLSSEFARGDVILGAWISSLDKKDAGNKDHKFFPFRASLRLDRLVIEGNTFDGNEVGNKGSAIYARQVTNLYISGNTISRSQPGYSFRPQAQEFSYYKYLAKGLRPTLFVQPTFFANVIDELDFASLDAEDAKLSPDKIGHAEEAQRSILDLPQVQGAIYVETCPSDCLVSYVVPSSGCEFCMGLLNHGITIENNIFEDNQDGFVFYRQQKFDRASQIFIQGTHDILITNNSFKNIKSLYRVVAPRKLPYFAHWLPDDYFDGLQSPLIRIKLTKGVKRRANIISVKLSDNDFVNNHLVQPWIPEAEFKGALLEVEAVETNTEVILYKNRFDDNYVRGRSGQAALISIWGPKVTATSNDFFRSGQLDTTIYKKTAPSNQLTVNIFDQTHWHSYTWTQKRGIFSLEGIVNTSGSPKLPLTSIFEHNVVEYAFGEQGCVYDHYVDPGVQSSYMLFWNNTYGHIYCLDSAIMKAEVAVSAVEESRTVHNHTSESIVDVQNGAYTYIGGDSDILVFFHKLKMLDSFGVTLDPVLYPSVSTKTLFLMTRVYSFVMVESEIRYTKDAQYWGVKPFAFQRYFTAYSRERSTAAGYLRTDTSTFIGATNEKGAIRLNSVATKDGSLKWLNETEIAGRDGSTTPLIKMMEGSLEMKYMKMNDTTFTSLIWNSTFDQICGEDVSVLYNDASIISVYRSLLRGCYSEFDAALGTTVLLQSRAHGVFVETTFEDNESRQGGAMYVKDGSSLEVNGSTFVRNRADYQGGAIMIEAQGVGGHALITNSSFYEQHSNQTAGAIGVNDGRQSNVTITNSRFANNTMQIALINVNSAKLYVSKSYFFDNTAVRQTNGFVASEATLSVVDSKIDNCFWRDCILDKKTNRRLSAVEHLTGEWRRLQDQAAASQDRDILAGFFYISSNSNMEIGSSIVKRVTGSLGGAVMLMTSSSVSITDGSQFKQVQMTDSTSTTSGVIEAQNAKFINIADSMFAYNEGNDVLCAQTDLTVDDTNFYGNAISGAPALEKNAPFINARGSRVAVANGTNFAYSVGDGPRGIVCDSCPNITATNNVRFDALSNEDKNSAGGAALALTNCEETTIEGVTFKQLKAYKGPAIYGKDSKIDMSNVRFRATQQGYVFEYTKDWEENDLYEQFKDFSDRDLRAVAPLLSLIWMDCTSPDACRLDSKGRTSASGSGSLSDLVAFFGGPAAETEDTSPFDGDSIRGWDVEEEPPAPLPKYLANYTYELINSDIDTKLKVASQEDKDQDLRYGQRLTYILEAASGSSLSAEIKLLNITQQPFVDENFANQTDQMQAIITYVDRGKEDLTNMKPNKGDWIAYSEDQVISFKNNFFRLKPGQEAYMEIQFAWPIKRDSDNATSVFAVDPNQGYQTRNNSDGEEMLWNFTAPVFWDNTLATGETRIIKVMSKECPKGALYYDPSRQICADCPKGTKTSKKMALECEACQQNAECEKGIVEPHEGYVMMHPNSYLVVRCFSKKACSGPLDKSPQVQNRTCSEGYQGVMCALCDGGNDGGSHYWKNPGTYQCYQCSYSDATSALAFKAAMCGFFILIVLFSVFVFRRAFSDKHAELIGMTRIIGHTFIVIVVIARMQSHETAIGDANNLQELLDRLSFFAIAPAVWMTDLQCLRLGWSAQEALIMKLRLSLGIIPVTAILCCLFVFIMSSCRRLCCKAARATKSHNKDTMLLTCAIVTHILLPEVILNLLAPTSCFKSIASERVVYPSEEQNPGPPDRPVMRMAILPDEYCDGEFYSSLSIYILPGLFLYAVLIPLLYVCQAAKKSHIIYRIGMSQEDKNLMLQTDEEKEKALEEEDSIKFRFGFFFSGLVISRREAAYMQQLNIKTTGGAGATNELASLSKGSEEQLEGGSPEKSSKLLRSSNQLDGSQSNVPPLQQRQRSRGRSMKKPHNDQLADSKISSAVEQQPPQPPSKCAKFVTDWLLDPFRGEGVRLNIQGGEKVRSYFYWEYVLHWQKVLLLATITFIDKPFLQGVAVTFELVAMTLLQVRNQAYTSKRLIHMHVVSLLTCVLLALCKLNIFQLASYSLPVKESTKDQIDMKYILLSRSYQSADLPGGNANDDAIAKWTLFGYSILAVGLIYYIWRFYTLWLIWLVESRQYNWFKVFTCCRWEIRNFVRSYMVRDASAAAEVGDAGAQEQVYPGAPGGAKAEDALVDASNADEFVEMAVIPKRERITDKLMEQDAEAALELQAEEAKDAAPPAEHDPDRRQSVASASNIVLTNLEGKELGPELDDESKKKTKEQLEKAKRMRDRERQSERSSASAFKPSKQTLIRVEEDVNESGEEDIVIKDGTQSSLAADVSMDTPLTDNRQAQSAIPRARQNLDQKVASNRSSRPVGSADDNDRDIGFGRGYTKRGPSEGEMDFGESESASQQASDKKESQDGSVPSSHNISSEEDKDAVSHQPALERNAYMQQLINQAKRAKTLKKLEAEEDHQANSSSYGDNQDGGSSAESNDASEPSVFSRPGALGLNVFRNQGKRQKLQRKEKEPQIEFHRPAAEDTIKEAQGLKNNIFGRQKKRDKIRDDKSRADDQASEIVQFAGNRQRDRIQDMLQNKQALALDSSDDIDFQEGEEDMVAVKTPTKVQAKSIFKTRKR